MAQGQLSHDKERIHVHYRGLLAAYHAAAARIQLGPPPVHARPAQHDHI